MKTEISASVRATIELDESEVFQVTGGNEYGGPEYTIQADRVRSYLTIYPKILGVELMGNRVLKDGSVSYTRKTIFVPDGDERIPAAVAEAVTAMRERVAHLDAYIAEEA